MKETISEFSVAVIGAGPAGSAASIGLAQGGITDFCLIDRAVFPRDKVCGDGLPLKAVRILNRMGFDDASLFGAGQKIRAMCIYGPDRSMIVQRSPIPTSDLGSGCVPRFSLDHLLFEKASALAKACLTGHQLVELTKETNRWLLTLKNLTENKTCRIRCKIVIGADGGNSKTARASGLINEKENHIYYGLRQYYRRERFESSVFIFYDRRILPGYVWIFPVSQTRANVGMMITPQKWRSIASPAAQIFKEILNTNPDIKLLLTDATPMDKIKGAILPLGSLPGARTTDGLILVGDAAAFINPLSGGGIYTALLSALKAAEVCIRSLNNKDRSKAGLSGYEKWWRKTLRPGFKYAAAMKRLFSNEKYATSFFKYGSRKRIFTNLFLALYGQPLPRFVYLNPLFWYKILRNR